MRGEYRRENKKNEEDKDREDIEIAVDSQRYLLRSDEEPHTRSQTMQAAHRLQKKINDMRKKYPAVNSHKLLLLVALDSMMLATQYEEEEINYLQKLKVSLEELKTTIIS